MSETLARAFPLSLQPSLAGALDCLPQTAYLPHGSIASSNSRDWSPITVQGDRVVIPHRIYNPVPAPDLVERGSEAGVAIDCLYTRHSDGFVRQTALRRVLASTDHPWTVPFVLQLLGEYVIEICDDIELFAETQLATRPGWATQFRSFADENPDFIVLTRQRATSYWECYYRGPHLYRVTYPGLRALALLVDGPSD
ncbi:hypothetical protein [Nocardioides sp.]|uniref:hypothetical protein n=1 Tax=Nocardioides sp. TaxID=35761 RepID=UPI00286E445D|nr:hypothetical protein [Nocardioides sp.]